MIKKYKDILIWIILSLPYFIAMLLLKTYSIRFLIPVLLIALILYLFKKNKIKLYFSLIVYLLLIFMLLSETITILFQEHSFDLRFFNLLTFESLVVGIEQFPLYSIFIVGFIFILFWVVKKLFHTINKKKGHTSFLSYIIIIIFLLVTPNSFSFFSTKLIAYTKYKQTMKHGIALPKINLEATKGNNLLLIYLESFEEEFTEKKNFKALTPYLQHLKKQSIVFKNNYMISGADYSIAGMFTSQCGAPYQYSNTKNLICLGDVLDKANYTQVFMQGTDMSFEHMGEFYKQHGYDELYGKKKLHPIGDPNKVNSWGITDEDLFTYAYHEFTELNKNYLKNGKLYNLTMFTSDTHNGSPSKSCPHYSGLFEENHFFQAYHCSDYLLKQFISKIRATKGSKNLTIALIGDHLQNFDMYASRLKKMNRRVFAIINTPDNKYIPIEQTTSHMAFTPTLLSAMKIKTNAKFIFGKNAFKLIPKDTIKKPFETKNNRELFKIINTKNYVEIINILKTKTIKSQLNDLYSYGASIKNISKEEIEKYFLPNLKEYKDFSTNKDEIYYSLDDNMLFIHTDKIFRKVHLYLETSDNQYYDNDIFIEDASSLPNNWYVWVFGNKFKNVNKININIDQIDANKFYKMPVETSPLTKNIQYKIGKFSTLLNFKNANPNALEKAIINLSYDKKLAHVKFLISDLYKNNSYPNRIKYRVIYHSKIIAEKDLAEDNQTLVKVDFLPNDHNITVEIEAQEGIEKNWSWGHAAKIQINFMEEK